MKKKLYAVLIYPVIFFIITGCSSLLPSEKRTVRSPWETFDDAKSTFDKIIPYQTTTKELKTLGFDPFTTPNIEMLTYLDIIKRFSNKSALDNEIKDCLAVKNSCMGYEVTLKKIDQERYGNVCLDMLNFRRRTKKSGWEFNILIVLKKNLVVYKLWSGKPKIDETVDKKNPLGPLQEMGDWYKIFLP